VGIERLYLVFHIEDESDDLEKIYLKQEDAIKYAKTKMEEEHSRYYVDEYCVVESCVSYLKTFWFDPPKQEHEWVEC